MAPRDEAQSAAKARLEVSPTGALGSWIDVSGAATSLQTSGGEIRTSVIYLQDSPAPVITYGGDEPFTINATIIYTEESLHAFEVLRNMFESRSDVHVRWVPFGYTGGNAIYTCPAGMITSLMYPPFEAGSADPIMSGFTWIGQKPVRSTF